MSFCKNKILFNCTLLCDYYVYFSLMCIYINIYIYVYQETSVENQFNRLNHQKQQTKKKSIQIPLVITYNHTLPNFRKILSDNWSLLIINNRLKNIFKEQLIIAYLQNKHLRDMIEDTTTEKTKVVRK